MGRFTSGTEQAANALVVANLTEIAADAEAARSSAVAANTNAAAALAAINAKAIGSTILGAANGVGLTSTMTSTGLTIVAPANGRVVVWVQVNLPSGSSTNVGLSTTSVLSSSSSLSFAAFSGLSPGATYTIYAANSASSIANIVVEG